MSLPKEYAVPSCDTDNSIVPWRYLEQSLKHTVRHHLAVIDLVEEMEEAFSGLFLMVFVPTLGLICLTVYHASMYEVENVKFVKAIGEVLISVLQIFTICYWGEQVIFESLQVRWAAYEADFVGTGLRFQKGLALIMCRSQNPTQITAGKFTEICLTVFAWVLRSSYSAFMILHGRSTSGR